MKIAIASGKGGTGKTLVSVNLYQTIINQGIAATLIDCDAEEPNVTQFLGGFLKEIEDVEQSIPTIDKDKCNFCGKCSEYCSYKAILNIPSVKFLEVIEELCHDCGACYIACNRNAISKKSKKIGSISTIDYTNNATIIEARMEAGVYSPVKVIKKAILSAKNNNTTLFDSPPGTSCPFIITANYADYVILVTEPTPFGLNDLKLSVDVLRKMNKSFGVIINRSGIGNDDLLHWLIQESIPILGEIPYDEEIAITYSKGELILNIEKYKLVFDSLYNTIKAAIEPSKLLNLHNN